MRVAELMETNLKTVSDDMTMGEAVVTLADAHVSAVPVLDRRRRFVGVLSTSDVLEAEAECATTGDRERLFQDTLVREIMTAHPQTAEPDDEVKEAAQRMLYLEVHRLFVVYDGELVGVISQSDIVRAVATAKI
jgi:CBS domain-containing protein